VEDRADEGKWEEGRKEGGGVMDIFIYIRSASPRPQASGSPARRRRALCFAAYDIRGIDELSRRTLRADSDTSGLLHPTPSEGRQSWHYDALSSPHLPIQPFHLLTYRQTQQLPAVTTGRMELWATPLTRRAPPPHPPGRQDLPGTTGRMRMDHAAGEHRGTRARRPRDLPGAGRHVSPVATSVRVGTETG
jgi:hypothetical protein